MTRIIKFLGLLAFSCAPTCWPALAAGDISSSVGEVDISGSALVGRRGSVDLAQFDPAPVIGSSGLLTLSDDVSVGPLPYNSFQFPGTAAVGTAAALSSIEYVSQNEINGVLQASAFLSSIEVDGEGVGSYGVSAVTRSFFDFQVDSPTDYVFEANAAFSDVEPSWQIRLHGSGGFLFNELTNQGGGLLTSSGTLQPGVNYRFSAFSSVGLSGPIPSTMKTASITYHLRAATSVPEPSAVSMIIVALSGIVLTQRRAMR